MNYLTSPISDLIPMTAIQTERLTAMNKHWSSADGSSNLISLALVLAGLILFFWIVRMLFGVAQKKSRQHTEKLREKNKNIE